MEEVARFLSWHIPATSRLGRREDALENVEDADSTEDTFGGVAGVWIVDKRYRKIDAFLNLGDERRLASDVTIRQVQKQ